MLYLKRQAGRGIALVVYKNVTMHRKSPSTDNLLLPLSYTYLGLCIMFKIFFKANPTLSTFF